MSERERVRERVRGIERKDMRIGEPESFVGSEC